MGVGWERTMKFQAMLTLQFLLLFPQWRDIVFFQDFLLLMSCFAMNMKH